MEPYPHYIVILIIISVFLLTLLGSTFYLLRKIIPLENIFAFRTNSILFIFFVSMHILSHLVLVFLNLFSDSLGTRIMLMVEATPMILLNTSFLITLLLWHNFYLAIFSRKSGWENFREYAKKHNYVQYITMFLFIIADIILIGAFDLHQNATLGFTIGIPLLFFLNVPLLLGFIVREYCLFQQRLHENYRVRRQSSHSVVQIQKFKFPKSLRVVGLACTLTLLALVVRGVVIIAEYVDIRVLSHNYWWESLALQSFLTILPVIGMLVAENQMLVVMSSLSDELSPLLSA